MRHPHLCRSIARTELSTTVLERSSLSPHSPRPVCDVFLCLGTVSIRGIKSLNALSRFKRSFVTARRCGGTTTARPSFRVSSRITLTDRATVLLGPCHNPLSSGTSWFVHVRRCRGQIRHHLLICTALRTGIPLRHYTALDLSSTVKRISYWAARLSFVFDLLERSTDRQCTDHGGRGLIMIIGF
jgi:hypothetical protein